jgi:hypothetical protein
MNSEPEPEHALRPVQPQPGVLVHPTADRRLAVQQWLLASTPFTDRARREWRDSGVAMLPLGGIMSAVRIPGKVLAPLTGVATPDEVDEYLRAALDGPVICDPRAPWYYALVPGRTPSTWSRAVDEWREVDVVCIGRDSYLAVPRVEATAPTTWRPYWSVPMESPGVLCEPLVVARLIANARHAMTEPDGSAPEGVR